MKVFRVKYGNRTFEVVARDALSAIGLVRDVGYSGYSMSNNAVQAYENGEMPKSKWNKHEVINAIAKEEKVKPSEITLLYPWDRYLRKSSWHHTSKNYNKTDFYSVDYEPDDIKIETEAAKRKKEQEAKEADEKLKKAKESLRMVKSFNPKNDVKIERLEGDKIRLVFPSTYSILYWKTELLLSSDKYVNVNLDIASEKIRGSIDFYSKIVSNLELRLKELRGG